MNISVENRKTGGRIANTICRPFGGMIAFCIIIGDTIPHVIAAVFPSLETAHFLWLLTDRRAVIIILVLGVAYPLSLYRDIAKVRAIWELFVGHWELKTDRFLSLPKLAHLRCSVCS